jgi:hypothetical protein
VLWKNPAQRNNFRISIIALALSPLLYATIAFGAENLKTESRMPHVHRIVLRDADGNIISPPPEFGSDGKPQDARGAPYSPAQTCGKCHEYESISKGWHFNAANPNVKAGRPGEPWIFTDPATRTQIPLSYRGWDGTFKPADIGLTDFDFLATFARHYPGGGVGEPAKDKINVEDAKMRRFHVTGSMEVDCLICHTADGHYDHEARYKSLAGENFKWSPTISAGLGAPAITRSAKQFADSWKPPKPAPTNLPPVKFERHRFDLENHVNFEVDRNPPSDNCYYCHTSKSKVADARWHADDDVHLRAGMNCVDCHRHGIDHMITRGYEGESNDRTISDDMIAIRAKLLRRDDGSISEDEAKKKAGDLLRAETKMVETLSCRGCHYGSGDGQMISQFGRLGAPEADHKGMPPIHFEKLSCTACHSGPFPTDSEQIVHTSLAHKLGIPMPARGENTAPAIVQPVFLRGADGKIAPHKIVWPSYWGRMKDGKVKPMLPEEAAKLLGDKLPKQTTEEVQRDPHNTKPLSDQQIKDALAVLAEDKANGEGVYLAAGKLYRLDGTALKAEEHESAKAYSWALAHDVRPASQALGVRGCADCHSDDSPIYFGTISARGPVASTNGVTKEMWALRGEDKTIASTFAFTFNFRPMLKYITFGSAFIVLAVIASYGLSGLQNITRGSRGKRKGDIK